MGIVITDYDWQRNLLYVQSTAIPSMIRVHSPDVRGRDVYTAFDMTEPPVSGFSRTEEPRVASTTIRSGRQFTVR